MKSRYLWICCLFMACDPIDSVNQEVVEGYVPIYGERTRQDITWQDPASVKNPGKIYLYNQYLLINEIQKGIHVYDNSDQTQPQPLGFIEIIGNTDMIIRNEVLYVDHLGSLVALRTEDFTTLQELGRLPINNWLAGLPPPAGFHFECIDASLGMVIGWKKQTLTNPDCYAF